MTLSAITAAWEAVRERRGMWTAPTPAEQAGSLLANGTLPEAIDYARSMTNPERMGYWAEVLAILESLEIEIVA